jgi:predicted permease
VKPLAGIALDLREAVRGLARHPSVAILAIVCLGLGVGTSGAMLGLLDTLLFRPPAHVARPEAVQRIYITNRFPGVGEVTASETSYPVLRDLEQARAFSAVGGFFSTDVGMGRGREARKAHAVLVTPGFLRALGVHPARGRLFTEAEDQPGAGSVALISDDLWHRGYGAAADILGRQLVIGAQSYAIVGILPPGFTGVDLEAVDVWLPMNAAGSLVGPKWATSRGMQFLEIVARLRPGRQKIAAQEATTLFRAAAAQAGRPKPSARVSLGPIQRAKGPAVSSSLRVVLWLTSLSWIVLLVCCANVASLLLLRGFDRQGEIGLRLALGAKRSRVARLTLCEGAVLAVAGGAVAALICGPIAFLLGRLILPDAASLAIVPPARTLAALAILAVLAALMSAVAPSIWSARRDLTAMIRTGSSRERSPGRSRLSLGIPVAQLALTLVLLAGAGTFARSLYNVLHLHLGIDASRVLVVTMDLESAGYTPGQIDSIFQLAASRLKALPRTERVALGATVPFESSTATKIAVPGVDQMPELDTGGPYINGVSEDFFATTGTRLLRGRPFQAEDRAGAAPVTIVNETMARLLWPGSEALGKCIRIGGAKNACAQVVGVVEDARRSELQEGPTLQCYVPLSQAPKSLSSRALFVRSTGDADALLGVVRREVQALLPDLPFVEVRSLADLLAPQVQPWRMGAAILALFGLVALVLALVGLYGVVAHSMARRTYELAVRVALGAQERDLLWLALRQGGGIGSLGAIAGVVLALSASHLLQPLLFQVSASDPAILGTAAALVVTLAFLASLIPGHRARRIAPAKALRAE